MLTLLPALHFTPEEGIYLLSMDSGWQWVHWMV